MRYPASAIGLPAHAWHKITWREGTAEPLSSRFARVRVRLSHRDYWLAECRHEEWLLIEWLRARQHQPNIGFQRLRSTLYFVGWSILQQAALAHRARLPRTQIGVWPWSLRGAKLAWLPRPRTLCIAACGFLVSERETSPSQKQPPPSLQGSCYSRNLSAEGIRHCGLNGTSRIRLRPSDED